MRKILSTLLLVALSLSLFACGGGDETNEDGLYLYSESGLEFALPPEMERMSVDSSYADVCYGDGSAEFFIFFYSRDALLEVLTIDKDSTVKEYSDWMIDYSMCTELEESYDEKNRYIEISFLVEDEGNYYIAIIMRNSESLIHVTMCCPIELRGEYEAEFALWKKYGALTYPNR